MKFNPLPWLLILIVLGLSLWVRADLIEFNELGFYCEGGGQGVKCALRWFIVQSFNSFGLGYFALFLGILATLTRSSPISLAAGCFGVAGLILYNWDFAAAGFLLGVLTLARTQFDEYRAEHRNGQQTT